MEKEDLYRSLKSLSAMSEWKVFEAHIHDVIAGHKEQGIAFLTKDKNADAARQAWICEGLMEAIEEPRSIIGYEENIVRKIINKACHFCGNLMKK